MLRNCALMPFRLWYAFWTDFRSWTLHHRGPRPGEYSIKAWFHESLGNPAVFDHALVRFGETFDFDLFLPFVCFDPPPTIFRMISSTISDDGVDQPYTVIVSRQISLTQFIFILSNTAIDCLCEMLGIVIVLGVSAGETMTIRISKHQHQSLNHRCRCVFTCAPNRSLNCTALAPAFLKNWTGIDLDEPSWNHTNISNAVYHSATPWCAHGESEVREGRGDSSVVSRQGQELISAQPIYLSAVTAQRLR